MSFPISGQLVFAQCGWTVIDSPSIPQPAGLPPIKMKSLILLIDQEHDAQLHFPMRATEAKAMATALAGSDIWTPPTEIIKV